MRELALRSVDVILQGGPDFAVEVGPGGGLAGSALSAFATTLVVSLLLVAFVPEYTERMIRQVEDDPLDSFLYGFLALLVLVVLIIAFAITIIGLVVAIPLVLMAYVFWAVGGAVAFLAIALRIVDRDDGWLKPILVAAAISGALVLTGIGGLVSLVIGAVGFGTVLQDFLD